MNNLDPYPDEEAEIHGDEEYDRKKCEAPDDVCSVIGCFEQASQWDKHGMPYCEEHWKEMKWKKKDNK